MRILRLVAALCAVILAGLVRTSPAGATAPYILLRTGTDQYGNPGTCTPHLSSPLDKTFQHCWSSPTCGVPLSTLPFTQADFYNACISAKVVIVNPTDSMLTRLPCDSLARWVDYYPNFNDCSGLPASVLYCAEFTVPDSLGCCPFADSIRICWSVDDVLGDPIGQGPNPDGAYVNGVTLGSAFRGGSKTTQTSAVAYNVPLLGGTNNLQIYQRDTGCGRSSVMLSCRIYLSNTTNSITGTKFRDDNCNGVWDAGEPGLPFWTISLAGPVSRTVQTDANGNYSFRGVPCGNYTLNEITQPGWIECGPSCYAGGKYSLSVGSPRACSFEGLNFGNSLCNAGDYCDNLPSCLTAWYPFNEGSGTTARDLVANYPLTFVSPAWTADRCGGKAADLSSATPVRYLTDGHNWQNSFGTGSFSIFAQVYMQPMAPGSIYTLLDKREPIPDAGHPRGYLLYIYNNALRLQLDAGGTPKTYISPANITSLAWHHVGVTVCRNFATPTLDTIRVYVDGVSTLYTGTAVESGNVTTTTAVPLTVGEQSAGLGPISSFDGYVDALQIYKCCLSPTQVGDLVANPCDPCTWSVYVPSVASTYLPGGGGPALSTIQICNYSGAACTFKWTIAGLPALSCGQGAVAGPTTFSSYSGCVTIASYPACASIPVQIAFPPGFSCQTDSACYQVTVKNMCDGHCKSAIGRIRCTPVLVASDTVLAMTDSLPHQVAFGLRNPQTYSQTVYYQLSSRSSDNDTTNQVVSLNGLPPGTPVTGTLTLAPSDTGTVYVTAALSGFEPLDMNEAVLSVNLDGSSRYLPVAADGLESVSAAELTSVEFITPPEPPTPGPSIGTASRLTVLPNPFTGETKVRFSLGGPEGTVRVGIFDVAGRLIRELNSGPMAAGEQTLAWDGRDGNGRHMGAGIYFVRVQSPGALLIGKVVHME